VTYSSLLSDELKQKMGKYYTVLLEQWNM